MKDEKSRERQADDSAQLLGTAELLFPRLHRPYASMNWIRFNGSLRAVAVSQPLDGTPLVNA
jgi:hypothetical protein